jgi:hypothetical protein
MWSIAVSNRSKLISAIFWLSSLVFVTVICDEYYFAIKNMSCTGNSYLQLVFKRILYGELPALYTLDQIALCYLLSWMWCSEIICMNNIRFLPTTWDQGILNSLIRNSGDSGHRVIMLIDWLDALSERTIVNKQKQKGLTRMRSIWKVALVWFQKRIPYNSYSKAFINMGCSCKRNIKKYKNKANKDIYVNK